MKSEPYAQFITRNSVDLMELLQTFHEVNHYYHGMFVLTIDTTHWELYDLRISRPIVRFPFKKIGAFRTYLKNLMHDMSTVRFLDSRYNGKHRLKLSELSSCRRILNQYGFDDYFLKINNL